MKRFYKFATVKQDKHGFCVMLDGKPIKTPGRNLLASPTNALANAIMQEWMEQGDKIVMHSMPLTQMLSTRIDRISTERAAMTAAILKYLDTDLLCYRAGPQPPHIGGRQNKAWDPWLDWFEKEFRARLLTTETLQALKQPEAARKAVEEFIDDLSDDEFNVLQLVVPSTGSLVLGLAFVKQAITPDDAFAAARVEENYKAELYNETMHGPDPAQEKKDCEMLGDLKAAREYLEFI